METEEAKAEHSRLRRREGRSGELATGDRGRQQVVESLGWQVEDEQLLLWVCQKRLVLPPSHQYYSSLQSHTCLSCSHQKPEHRQWKACLCPGLHLMALLPSQSLAPAPLSVSHNSPALLLCFCSDSRGKASHLDTNQAPFLLLFCCCKLSRKRGDQCPRLLGSGNGWTNWNKKHAKNSKI